jgi:hypothetical protein
MTFNGQTLNPVAFIYKEKTTIKQEAVSDTVVRGKTPVPLPGMKPRPSNPCRYIDFMYFTMALLKPRSHMGQSKSPMRESTRGS